MRLTLEQLKSMTADELDNLWCRGAFPFDLAECGLCATLHQAGHCKYTETHRGYVAAARTIPRGEYGRTNSPQALKANLEELYALRLFYDHLYPQPAEPDAEKLAQDEQESHDEAASLRELGNADASGHASPARPGETRYIVEGTSSLDDRCSPESLPLEVQEIHRRDLEHARMELNYWALRDGE